MRAVELFDQELEKTAKQEDVETEGTAPLFEQYGARLYYVVGGILLSLQRRED
mgnify:CR=1 FL=1